MRRILLIIVLAAFSAACVFGCTAPATATPAGNENSPAPSEATAEDTQESAPPKTPAPTGADAAEVSALAEDGGTDPQGLVVYFSATGRTRAAAESIAEAIGAQTYEIMPEEPYTEADRNYRDDGSRAMQEMDDGTARPAITGTAPDMSGFDVIYLGYPIWGGQAPRIIETFLDTNDLAGKTVVPFCTSGSTGISASVDTMRREYPDVNWQDGARIADPGGDQKMAEWSEELGFWPFGE